MAYNEILADRIRQILNSKKIKSEEKRMMGGLTFMVNNKMCVGIVKNDLMARVGKNNYESTLKMKGAREMGFTGKPMKGYVFVSPEGLDKEEDFETIIDMCLEFNLELIKSR